MSVRVTERGPHFVRHRRCIARSCWHSRSQHWLDMLGNFAVGRAMLWRPEADLITLKQPAGDQLGPRARRRRGKPRLCWEQAFGHMHRFGVVWLRHQVVTARARAALRLRLARASADTGRNARSRPHMPASTNSAIRSSEDARRDGPTRRVRKECSQSLVSWSSELPSLQSLLLVMRVLRAREALEQHQCLLRPSSLPCCMPAQEADS